MFLKAGLDKLLFVPRDRKHLGLTGANQKRIPCCVDCHGVITCCRRAFATYKIAHVNGSLGSMKLRTIHGHVEVWISSSSVLFVLPREATPN